MSAGEYTRKNGGAVPCPNGCGRWMTRSRSVKQCLECHIEAVRRSYETDRRDLVVLAERKRGTTFAALGLRLGISTELVRQIAKRAAIREQRDLEREIERRDDRIDGGFPTGYIGEFS